MKKMIILVSAALVALSSEAETRECEPFAGVNVNVPARVRFVSGDAYHVDIQSTDTLTASAIRCYVKDGVLRISSTGSGQRQEQQVCITITSPAEPALRVARDLEVKPTKRVRK
ncbi:MAG: DUF2807 domain-containing protein [Prevotellaceae bacterium]|nr:DUF2807 domain-containing protein [Prevotellaceae bacterium]